MALMGSPHVSGAVKRGRDLMNRYARAGIQRPTQPGEYGFNKNFQNVNGSLTAIPNGGTSGPVNPGFAATGLMAQASAPQPITTQGANAQATTSPQSGLPPSPPVGTPPVSPSGPGTGLGDVTGANQTPTSNQNLYQNTAPTSTPGAVPFIQSIPGITGPVSQQRVDDQFAWLLDALNNRNRLELGGVNGPGGNNLDSAGNWVMPDWLMPEGSAEGLMAQYGSGANTDAMTRSVTGDETVAGQLGKLSLRNSDLNRIAMQDAREAAAASGMIGGSTAAEGAALRASRAAMLPVAQQDAAWYGATSQSNMDAVNRDRLSDQDLRTGLLSQNQQIAAQDRQTAAQLYENASDRRWKSKEANHERLWNSFENQLNFLRQGTDREDQQNFAIGDREDQQDWNAWQGDLQRTFQSTQAQLDRTFQGDQAGLNRAHERQTQFFNAMFGREGTMASILASIYGNPDLTPQQQQAAASNARQIMAELWSSFNTTIAAGMPDIFGGQPGTTTPGTPPTGGAPGRPPGGYQQLPNGQWPSPVLGTNPDGTPIYATNVGTREDGIPIFEDQNGNPIPYP